MTVKCRICWFKLAPMEDDPCAVCDGTTHFVYELDDRPCESCDNKSLDTDSPSCKHCWRGDQYKAKPVEVKS